MKMENEIECEYNQFLADIKKPEFLGRLYMDEDEYEDEYSHNEIHEAMHILRQKIQNYLRENRPGEFVVYSDFCVHVMTPRWARKWNLPKQIIERFLVK